jgi:hypothetical protein
MRTPSPIPIGEHHAMHYAVYPSFGALLFLGSLVAAEDNPIKGTLHFEEKREKGDWTRANVGKDWEERRYIAPSTDNRQHAAVWRFQKVPASLGKRDRIDMDLSWDAYHVAKRDDKHKLEFCISFINRSKWRDRQADEFLKAKDHKASKPLSPEELARKFGRFDHRPQSVEAGAKLPLRVSFPGSLLADLKEGDLEVRVEFHGEGLYLGFAPGDLVLRVR